MAQYVFMANPALYFSYVTFFNRQSIKLGEKFLEEEKGKIKTTEQLKRIL